MNRDLTRGNVTKAMLLFSVPLVLGNLLQQLYNVVDTLIVGQFLGAQALAAVGSSYTLMVFLTSINLGFCMGSGVVFSHLFGAKKIEELKTSIGNAFVFVGGMSLLTNIVAYLLLDKLLVVLNIQPQVVAQTKSYLLWIFSGIMFTFLYNFFAAVLRSLGNSATPLLFLGIAAVMNIVLDIIFVVPFQWGVAGAAIATVISQAFSAVVVAIYFYKKMPEIAPHKEHFRLHIPLLKKIISHSILTSVQQSIMNFGILMIQGLVNSFGVTAMAAFAAAVKIDSFAYMPVQDFGNAFSTFIAQNHGAGKPKRIHEGIRQAVKISTLFCVFITLAVTIFARPLMLIFVHPSETAIIVTGATYLRIEGAFYCLIGILFLLYGFYRGLGRPGISVVLTLISLGCRVILAYVLAPNAAIGIVGIWWAIPIGWLLADLVGFGYYLAKRKTLLPAPEVPLKLE